MVTEIGIVRSPYTDRLHTPVQSSLNTGVTAELHVHPRHRIALDGLDGFDHAWLLSWLGDPDDDAGRPLRNVPFLLRRAPQLIGAFASRTPTRPTPIGLHLVRVVDVDLATGVLSFAGVDLTDGTAVVDVKPYVPAFDRTPEVGRSGWYEQIDLLEGATPASLEPPVGDA